LKGGAKEPPAAVAGRELTGRRGLFVYDLILAALFFGVVLSPLAIHGWQDWMERRALRREAEEAAPTVEVGVVVVE